MVKIRSEKGGRSADVQCLPVFQEVGQRRESDGEDRKLEDGVNNY